MRVKLTIEPDGIPDVHISFEEMPDTVELMMVVDAVGLDQQELAGTLLDLARTVAGAEQPRPRFNPQPRARGLS